MIGLSTSGATTRSLPRMRSPSDATGTNFSAHARESGHPDLGPGSPLSRGRAACARACRSSPLQTGVGDDGGPSLVLGLDVAAELLRRAADPRDARRLQRLGDVVRLERLVG